MSMRKCDICNISTPDGDSVYFGEWMTKKDIQVHYYCLLLSTHLPQNGKDGSGILGFLLSDIRKEIVEAQKRICFYCSETGAHVMCRKCKKYLHLVCGQTNKCLFIFINEFPTYCHSCIPVDREQLRVVKANPPTIKAQCFICKLELSPYDRSRLIYGKCCGNGYVHSKCMKKYALSAGYYLICIWCKSVKFRDDVKYQGIFVPDRDSNWELEKGAFKDLYRKYRRCDVEVCHCPKGRDYINAKWQVIICKYCGANGAHNPFCMPGFQSSTALTEYQCETCSVTEQTICHNTTIMHDNTETDDSIDCSLYIPKNEIDLPQNRTTSSLDYSDDSASSVETVVHVENRIRTGINKSLTNSIIPTLTQSDDGSLLEPASDKIIALSKKTEAIIDKNVAGVQEKDEIVTVNQASDDTNGGAMKVIEEQYVKQEILETEEIIEVDVNVTKEKTQGVLDNQTIDDAKQDGMKKLSQEKDSLELMETNVVEEPSQGNQDNRDMDISNSSTVCEVKGIVNEEEDIPEIIVNIPNAAAYVYPVTNKLIAKLRKLDPNAAKSVEEKRKIIAELQRNNPYGITEYASSDDSEDEEDQLESERKNEEIENYDSSDYDCQDNTLIQKILEIFEKN